MAVLTHGGSAGTTKGGVYDIVIRTQTEFETLIASPDWLGAVSVCFVGDGGALKFTRSDGQGIKIPQTVKTIQGMNLATIEVTNFTYNSSTNKAALWYETLPTSCEYTIRSLQVLCSGKGDCSGFYNCTHVTNCKATSSSIGASTRIGFNHCTKLTDCFGEALPTSGGGLGYGYGFYDCTQLENCAGTGSGKSGGLVDGAGYGFIRCAQLLNCTSAGNSVGEGVGFHDCSQLTNCISDYSGIAGFGFSRCTQLVNCTGTGTGTSNGYGFYNCTYLNGCKQGDTASTTAFLGGSNTKVDTATVVAS